MWGAVGAGGGCGGALMSGHTAVFPDTQFCRPYSGERAPRLEKSEKSYGLSVQGVHTGSFSLRWETTPHPVSLNCCTPNEFYPPEFHRTGIPRITFLEGLLGRHHLSPELEGRHMQQVPTAEDSLGSTCKDWGLSAGPPTTAPQITATRGEAGMVFRFVLHGSKSSRPPLPRGRAWGCSPVSPEHGGDPWEMGFAGRSLLLALPCP